MPRSQEQKVTLDSYNSHFDVYIEKTVSEVKGYHKKYLDHFLSFIDKEDEIFEIGTGAGRDADYIDDLGYSVIRSDCTQGFIDYNKQKNKPTLYFNVLDDQLDSKYKNIMAMAVFLHFTYDEFKMALRNVYEMLDKDGVFALEVKHGAGEEWTNNKLESPRYFWYWNPDSILKEVSDLFEVLHIDVVDDNKWLELILRKNKNA